MTLAAYLPYAVAYAVGYTGVVREGRVTGMGTATIDLEAAGLTHAKGKSDRCDGKHDIDMLSVVSLDDPDWTRTDGLPAVFQALHEQAHPGGAAYWLNCREAGCAEAYDLLNGDE